MDKFNYHQFQPLFYQVATAALDASNISFPLRKAFQGTKNVHVRIEELKGVNTAEKKILTNAEDIHYDVLVLATGADTNFFGNQQVATNAFPMKSVVESLQLRHRLIQNFEDALLAKTADELQRLLNIVIVGGGPTGVEVAGALAEMKRYVLPRSPYQYRWFCHLPTARFDRHNLLQSFWSLRLHQVFSDTCRNLQMIVHSWCQASDRRLQAGKYASY